ncbi:hypothetical protein EXIGLDRAFT_746571 [Exidia glandulosa HHB12029]|uniref:F-box domain-containing protein n=1 Tax=Exidia glandulosa HHB12029 TaxID=1314781 RepID=A0A166B7F6_EXIGL|nr:hypothetical protein EXIGLDRAFT_746571 [Exidia glandulosa HHB12029]
MQLQPVLPIDRFNTLQLAVHDACVAATATLALQSDVHFAEQIRVSRPAQNGSPTTVFSLVLDAVWSGLQNYAQQQNVLHSAATRVVPEIMCEIFAYLSFEDRISTSHVCHKWRDASLAFPARLWSTVPDTTRLRDMESLLARTGARGLPVDLMRVYRDGSDQIPSDFGAKIIASHMFHIRTLKLCMGACSFDQVCKLADALHTAAPLVRTFCLLSLPYNANEDRMFLAWQNVFAGNAPLLQHVELHNCWRYLFLFGDFSSIRSIALLGVPFYAGCPAWQALHAFPSLEKLEILGTPYPRRNDEKIVLPDTVTHLAMTVDIGKDLARLDLTVIDIILSVYISVSSLHLDELATPLAATEIEPFLRDPFHPHSMVVTYGTLGHYAWRCKLGFSVLEQEDDTTTRPPKMRTFLDVDQYAFSHPPIWKSTFGGVTALVLYVGSYKDVNWPKMDFAVCGNIKELTIQHLRWDTDNIADPIPGGMTFPGLRILTLLTTSSEATSRGDETRQTFDFDDLAELTRRLSYTAQTLEQLRLRGLDFVPRSGLYDIADDVRFEEGGAEAPDLQQSPARWMYEVDT